MAVDSMDLSDYSYGDLYNAIKSFINLHHPGWFAEIAKPQNVSVMYFYYEHDSEYTPSDRVITLSLTHETTAAPFGFNKRGNDTNWYYRSPLDTTGLGPNKIWSTTNGFMITWAFNRQLNPLHDTGLIVVNEPDYGLVGHGYAVMGRALSIKSSTECTADWADYSVNKQYVSAVEIEHINYDNLNNVCLPSTKTMMIPIVLDSGHVCENLFRQVYSENPGTKGVFTLGGNTFVSNGYFALKD